MQLNELPDDCLMIIIQHVISDYRFLDDFIRLSHVSERWRKLIRYQLKKKNYLLMSVFWCRDHVKDFISLKNYESLKHLALNKWLPNLKILQLYDDVPSCYCQPGQDNSSIKGLVYPSDCRSKAKLPARNFPNLEMILLTGAMDPYFKDPSRGNKLKQIHITAAGRGFTLMKDYAANLPNLERLHLNAVESDYMDRHMGPIFSNLKILEINARTYETNFVFQYMDHCPSLQSAFLRCSGEDYHIDPSIINENLKDLVIENVRGNDIRWNDLHRLLLKYPNLEHLALRGNEMIYDDHIKIMVKMAPKLKVLDFRDSPGVTARSAGYLAEYCGQSGRSLVIYYHCMKRDSPQDLPSIEGNYNPIAQEFDFMKNCFFNYFYYLPLFAV